jgi:acetyl-CoA acetyltransferase
VHLRHRYAVAGVGYTPQGRVPGRTALSFHLEACVNALRDAGLQKQRLDGLICYRHFPPSSNENELDAFEVARNLGISPRYIYQDANCSRSQLQHAVSALDSGMCDHVLISYGHSAASGDSLLSMLATFTGDGAAFGHFGAAGSYALAARRAMHEHGTGPETWKHIAAGQRAWARRNPRAVMRAKPLTFEQYLSSSWIVEPFRQPDHCLINDGGRAVLITSLERARDLKQPPAVILGLGSHHPAVNAGYSEDMAGPTGARKASEEAFRMAGITVGDVDACQIYDCFTYTVEATLRDYGFFAAAESGDWFRDNTIGPGGRMPVNTSGGQLSEAYFMGLTPLAEAAMQLMGRCGERQLGAATGNRQPEIIVCSDNGGILQSHCCCVLGKE